MPLPKKFPGSKGDKSKDNSEKQVLANRYQLEKKLGSGNFGTAYLVKDLRCKDPKEEWKVMKKISVGDLQPDETVDAMHEANLLAKLDHPGIVKFHDSFLDGEFFCIVTEYCEGGDLDDKITALKKSGKHLEESQVIEWFIQLVLAVQYMHSRRVLHRDLKTRNIFLKNNLLKLGDFGISRILMGTTDMATTFTGTPYYMSPEVLKHEGYNSKSDVWSVGCILYELCALEHAFEGQSLMGVMYKIVEGNQPELPEKYSKQLGKVLKLMLTKEPSSRPSASELTKVSFVQMHIEKLKNTIVEKHHKDQHAKDQHLKEAADIEIMLKKKTHLSDLQSEEEDVKWKNLSPRERMRLRKQQKADEEAKKLQQVTQAAYETTQQKKAEIRASFEATSIETALGHSKLARNNKGPPRSNLRARDAAYNARPMTAPEATPAIVEEEFEEDFSAADAMAKTYAAQTMVPRQLNTVREYGDDRPITPMKDKMVYDLKNSSLDFKDGIPDTPQAAETFYSQYEDFEELDEVEEDIEGEDEDVEEEEEEDQLGGTADSEVDHLIGYMQHALDKSDADKSITISDDSIAGAFGPGARDIKIKNLRTDCISKLGKDAFEKAYHYLKKARFGDGGVESGRTMDENQIMNGLRQIVKNPSDCFLVDQLLFLEEQLKFGH